MAVAVLINSCEGYHSRSLPPLLASLASAGVPATDVFVVVGQAEADRDGELGEPGYKARAFWRRWANMDNNGLVWAARDAEARHALAGYPWLFYTHDTSIVDPGFGEQVARVAAQLPPDADAARIYRGMSMSMGYYRPARLAELLAASPTLEPNYDTSPGTVLRIKAAVEDSAFHAIAGLGGRVEVLPNEYFVARRDAHMYGTDTPRIVEHYAVPGVSKAKANWTRYERLDL